MKKLTRTSKAATVPAVRSMPPAFGELVDRFLSSQDIRDASKRTYARALKQFGAWIDDAPRGEFNRETVLQFKNDLIGRGLAALTIDSYLTAVKRFFAWAESMKYYPNIAKDIGPMERDPDFKKDHLTPQQALDMLAAIDTRTTQGKRDFAIINLMIRTGLRTIEITRANIGDISNKEEQNVLYIQGKGRNDKNQFVVLTPAALQPINDYLQTRTTTGRDAPLFAAIGNRNQNGRMTTRSISRLTKAAIERIAPGRDRLTAHSCRHSAATFALLGGATVQETQVMARHRDINTTLRYLHNIDRIGKAPELKIDAFLKREFNHENANS